MSKEIIIKDKYLLFWDGWPSQWYPSTFEIDGIKFNCAEQWMMYSKAILFKDLESAGKILKEKNPYIQKMILGRNVKNFQQDIWDKEAKNIVYKGNVAKFTQNEILKEEIINSKNLVIVEASPTDKIWGIGLYANDPDAINPNKWKGKNWLGQVIMWVRYHLLTGLDGNEKISPTGELI